MLIQVLKRQNIASKKNSRSRSLWLIFSLFAVVLVLEFTTPVDYVFGYLYTGPILLATSCLGRKATFYTTLIAVVLTILNLWIPGNEPIEPSIVATRSIAVMALVVTGILSDRNSSYEHAITQQQAKLQAQDQLTKIRSDFASTLTHDLKTPLLGAIETLKALGLSADEHQLNRSQIEDLRLAAAKLLRASRRSFQAEMSLKYCQAGQTHLNSLLEYSSYIQLHPTLCPD